MINMQDFISKYGTRTVSMALQDWCSRTNNAVYGEMADDLQAALEDLMAGDNYRDVPLKTAMRLANGD